MFCQLYVLFFAVIMAIPMLPHLTSRYLFTRSIPLLFKLFVILSWVLMVTFFYYSLTLPRVNGVTLLDRCMADPHYFSFVWWGALVPFIAIMVLCIAGLSRRYWFGGVWLGTIGCLYWYLDILGWNHWLYAFGVTLLVVIGVFVDWLLSRTYGSGQSAFMQIFNEKDPY